MYDYICSCNVYIRGCLYECVYIGYRVRWASDISEALGYIRTYTHQIYPRPNVHVCMYMCVCTLGLGSI